MELFTKTCRLCGEEKPGAFFGLSSKGKLGSRCQACIHKKYKQNNELCRIRRNCPVLTER